MRRRGGGWCEVWWEFYLYLDFNYELKMYVAERLGGVQCSLIYHMGVVVPGCSLQYIKIIYFFSRSAWFLSQITLRSVNHINTRRRASVDILETEKLLFGRDWSNSSTHVNLYFTKWTMPSYIRLPTTTAFNSRLGPGHPQHPPDQGAGGEGQGNVTIDIWNISELIDLTRLARWTGSETIKQRQKHSN